MSADLRPYPVYKESGLPWLGQVPAHWEENRGKYYFREVDERSVSGEEELLSVSHVTGVTPRKATVTMFMADSNVGHKVCRPGDLVINTMWAWMAALGVSRRVGLVSPSYGVYRPRRGDLHSPEYLDHLLRTQPYASEYLCRSTGIRASRLRLYPDDFLDIRIVRPPIVEQEAMVRFIAHHDRVVHRFIRNRRRLIEVLNEQKQAIINWAVTRSLDPNVPLKPSGIDWLGDISKHWRTVRLGLVIDLLTGFPFKSSGFTDVQSDVRLLRGVNVSPGRVRWDSVVRWPASDISGVLAFELKEGDIVFGMDRPVVSGGIRVATVTATDVPSLLLQRVARLRARSDLDQRYLLMLLQDRRYADYLAPIFTGISVPHISPTQISDYRIALPPLAEQHAILERVASETRTLELAISRAQYEIDLIRECRTRLIADVVTGKVDVRHLAPGPSDEPVVPEELADSIEDDEMQVDDEAELAEEAGA